MQGLHVVFFTCMYTLHRETGMYHHKSYHLVNWHFSKSTLIWREIQSMTMQRLGFTCILDVSISLCNLFIIAKSSYDEAQKPT